MEAEALRFMATGGGTGGGHLWDEGVADRLGASGWTAFLRKQFLIIFIRSVGHR